MRVWGVLDEGHKERQYENHGKTHGNFDAKPKGVIDSKPRESQTLRPVTVTAG